MPEWDALSDQQRESVAKALNVPADDARKTYSTIRKALGIG